MRALSIRDVPDDVCTKLEAMAVRDGLSLEELVVRELTHAATRAHNAALLADLPSFELTSEDVVSIVREGRAPRGCL